MFKLFVRSKYGAIRTCEGCGESSKLAKIISLWLCPKCIREVNEEIKKGTAQLKKKGITPPLN